MVFATSLSIIFVLGCDIAGVYFVSSKRFSISEGVTYVLIYGGMGSLSAIIAGLLVMHLPLSFLSKATPKSFHLALGTIPCAFFSLVFLRLLTAVHQFGWFAIMSITHGLAKFLLTILFVRLLLWRVDGALFATICAGIITSASTLLLLRWKYKVTLIRPSIKPLFDMFYYGLRYHLGKTSNLMNFKIGTLILAFFATKEQIGLFDVASNVATAVILVPDVMTTILIPRVAEDKTGRRELIAQSSRLMALFCGTLLLVLALFARPIVIVLFSPAFLSAVSLVRILIVGVFVRCVCKVFVPYLLGTNHPGIESISVVIGITVNLLVLLVLLPVIGLPAAAIGIVAGYFASSTLLTLGFVRLSGLRAAEIWRFRWSDLRIGNKAVRQTYCRIVGTRRGQAGIL
jgi:O-antigen/teichoic acid export membrane protein